MKPRFTMRHALSDPSLLGSALRSPPVSLLRRARGSKPADSWATWRTFLIASQGEPLTPEEEVTFRQYTGGRSPPTEPCHEQVYACGRRAGKDASTAVKAAYLATCVEYPQLAPGERGTLLIVAPDTAQAAVQFGYIRAVLEGSPLLSQRITGQTADTISLDNGVDIVVRASSFRRLRGLTCIGVIASETAFWLTENSSNPDTEILRAIRPALLTTGGPLIQISTPYAKSGELWNAYHKHFGKDGPVLVVSGASRDFNPTLDQAEIDRAYEGDPEAARAEYGAEFRDDISAFVDRATLMACVCNNVREIGPRGARYFGFCDPSGGSNDSMCFAIAHEENDRIAVDLLIERRPPFSPDDAVREIASACKRYGIGRIEGDHYAAQWVVEAFAKNGIAYRHCELATSDLFRELVPVLNTRGVSLLDNPRAIGQLCALERRVGRSGKDAIGHPPGAHDDLACVVAGVVYLAGTQAARRGVVSVGCIGPDGKISWPERGRTSAFDASRGECIPSASWLRANDKRRYGSSFVKR